MFELICGIILIAICSVITYMISFTYSLIEAILFLGVFLLFFGLIWICAICLTVTGLIKVIKNILNAMFGDICYGKILRIRDTGARLGNKSQLLADVLVFIPYM